MSSAERAPIGLLGAVCHRCRVRQEDLLRPGPQDLEWARLPGFGELLARLNLEALSWDAAQLVHDLVIADRPSACLEVGLGQGASTLAILQALETLGAGQLLSIDRNREPPGLPRVSAAGVEERHTFVCAPSYLALPSLVRDDRRFQFAMIDGRHLFDYLLVDLFYTDLLLEVGGLMVVDDVDRPELERAARFFETNRGYSRVGDVPPRLAVLRKGADDSREHEWAPF